MSVKHWLASNCRLQIVPELCDPSAHFQDTEEKRLWRASVPVDTFPVPQAVDSIRVCLVHAKSAVIEGARQWQTMTLLGGEIVEWTISAIWETYSLIPASLPAQSVGVCAGHRVETISEGLRLDQVCGPLGVTFNLGKQSVGERTSVGRFERVERSGLHLGRILRDSRV